MTRLHDIGGSLERAPDRTDRATIDGGVQKGGLPVLPVLGKPFVTGGVLDWRRAISTLENIGPISDDTLSGLPATAS